MIILAIDTSCDETSVAVTDGLRVLSNTISSQVRFHKKYGGVVPFLAQRLHQERIGAMVEIALQRSKKDWSYIKAIAVTQGPGLAPALQVGIAHAKELAARHKLPLYAINHMAGHIASCLAQTGAQTVSTDMFPAVAVLVSGKHSEFVAMPHFGKFKILGQTLDDALGEAYDKVARMLGLGYPGGRLVAELAKKGDPNRFELPIPLQHSKDTNLSYSGLKNAVRLLIEKVDLDAQTVADICAGFQRVAQQSLLLKLKKVLDMLDARTIFLAGGVAANVVLRAEVRKMAKEYGLKLLLPANQKLCGDNAAMIGAACYLGIQQGQRPVDIETLDRKPSLSLELV